jgi:hypothetical protein
MFKSEVAKIRVQEAELANATPDFFERNRRQVADDVRAVVAQIKEKRA